PSTGPAEAPPVDEPAPPERRSTDPVFSLFALVSALTRAGGHLEDEVRSWSEEPGGWTWNARWDFLRHLATAASLLVRRPDGAVGVPPGLATQLDDPTTLSDRLWRAYLRDPGWSELREAGFEDGADLADTLGLRRA